MLTFEIYVTETVKGTFITQRRNIMVTTVNADNQAEADAVARVYGGYAVLAF